MSKTKTVTAKILTVVANQLLTWSAWLFAKNPAMKFKMYKLLRKALISCRIKRKSIRCWWYVMIWKRSRRSRNRVMKIAHRKLWLIGIILPILFRFQILVVIFILDDSIILSQIKCYVMFMIRDLLNEI